MAKTRKDINHLNAGEWSTKVYNRSDHEKHASACRQAKNVISTPHGAVTKRKGFEMVAPAKYDNRIFRPVRFRFSKSDTMLLEMGHEYVRFHVNRKQVRETAKSLESATAADPVVVTSTAHGYSDGDEVYIDDCEEMTELNGRWLIVSNKTTDTFELTDRDGNDIDGSAWTAESTGGFVEKVYEIASIYEESELYDLDYAQKNDVMWFCDGNNPVQRLIRFGLTNWTFTEYEFAFPPALDPNVEAGQLLEVDATTGTGATMTASGHTPFTADHVGSYWVLRHFRESEEIAASGVTNAIKALGNLTFETSGKWNGTVTVYKSIVESPNFSTYTASEWIEVGSYTSASADENGKNFNVRFEQEDEARYYFLGGDVSSAKATLRSEASLVEGAVKVTAFTSSTEVTVDIVEDLHSTAVTEDWSEGAWSDVQGYPATVALFEKALWFARTDTYPQGIWKSETDLFDSYKLGNEDTDGLFIELDSKERNDILWMVPSDKLMIGTSGSEWTLSGTDLNSIISPTNIVARRQENKGSKDIRPETVDDTIMYVQRGSTERLRELAFSLERDKFHGADMQIFSEHLTSSGIVSVAYQSVPNPIIWVCCNDGRLLSFTYEKDQNVYAWNPHDTQGYFEGVETVYSADDDEVWVCAKRTIDGTVRRFVERLSGVYNPSVNVYDSGQNEDAQICFCVDTTGSMRSIIEDTLELADQIASIYGSAYRDVQFALIGFKDEDDDPVFDPIFDFASYTSFREELAAITVFGGGTHLPENGYGAIVKACEDLSWRSGYDHQVLLFTDEASHERGATQAEALAALNSVEAEFIYGTTTKAGYTYLSNQTGGFNFTSVDDFVSQLGGFVVVPETISGKRFLDCSSYFPQNTSLSINKLWHLEGEEVFILADGYVLDPQTVTNGTLTFDQTYSIIFVGFGYDAIVQPLQINADQNVGSSRGYTKVISAVYASLIDTAGISYCDGSKDASGALKYRSVSFREGNADQSLPPALFNGDVELMTNTGHERDPVVILKSSDPLPFTLAALVIHYDVTSP